MEFQFTYYIFLLILSGAITGFLGIYAWQYRSVRKGVLNFSLLMLAGSWWALSYSLQLIEIDFFRQLIWYRLNYVGITLVPVFWFVFAYQYMRIEFLNHKKWLWALYIIPIISQIAAWASTPPNLFWSDIHFIDQNGFMVIDVVYGPLFWVHLIQSYLLLLLGVVILFYGFWREPKRYTGQIAGLVIGMVTPWIGNALIISGFIDIGSLDITPVLFVVTGLGFGWSIFNSKLLSVVSIAHDKIVQGLNNAVFVLDNETIIIDANQTAIKVTQKPLAEMIGKEYNAVFYDWPNMVPIFPGMLQEISGLSAYNLNTQKTYRISTSIIYNQHNRRNGQIVEFEDISSLIEGESALKRTQANVYRILETIVDPYFEANLAGNLTYANPAFCEAVGMDQNQAIGMNFRKVIANHDVRRVIEAFVKMIEVEISIKSFEYEYITSSGELRYGELSATLVYGENDSVVGTRGFIRDITERLYAEKEILEQKDLLDGLLQQSPIAMVINDVDNRIREVNPAFEKLFGYSQVEVSGKNLDDILSTPENIEEMKSLTKLGITEQASLEGQRARKDGSLIDVEIFAAPLIVRGECFGYLAFYIDISTRLKAEIDRKQVQLTYRTVLDTLQDPYFEADSTGKITFVNRAYYRTLGYSNKEEVLGKNFRHFSDRKTFRNVVKQFREIYQTKKTVTPFNYHYRRKDNSIMVAEIVVSPIIDNDEVVGTRGIIRDISVRIKAEEVLRQAKEAAEYQVGALAAINRVASTVSQSLDFKEILQSVCKELTTIFNIRNAGIGLLTSDKTGLEIVAFHAIDGEEVSALGMVLPLEGNPSSQDVLSKMKTIVIQDAQSDPRTSSVADISKERGTKAIMIVPLLTRGESIGTIGMPAKDPDYIFTKSDIELAETIASQIAVAVDNARMYEKTESALDVAEGDLEIGRQIQSGFFPEKLPDIPGWEIGTHFHAARQVAGDFYDVFKFKDSNLVAFIIADVCDKGVGAALFMVLFRSLLRAFSETIKINSSNIEEHLLNIILNTNNFIAEYHGASNMFATMFFGILDHEAGDLYYVNGGHEPPPILDKEGTIIQRLMPTGPAVGLFPDMDFRIEKIHLNKGDILFGFTDGATDAKNNVGELFTEERLLNNIGFPWTSLFSMIFELNTELEHHIGDQKQFDDITLLALRRKMSSANQQHAICRVADMNIIGELRNFVESVVLASGLSQDDAFAFKLAIDEICTNIIQYGYEGREPGALSLSFEIEGNKARLTIKDDGKYFSPDQTKKPDIEANWDERDMGGLGIYCVKELMDNVSYNKEDDTNVYVLEKEINSENQR